MVTSSSEALGNEGLVRLALSDLAELPGFKVLT